MVSYTGKRESFESGKVSFPDLETVKGTKAMVLDLAAPFVVLESTLRDSEQTDKYKKVSNTIKHLKPGATEVFVGGFPVGARIKWQWSNNGILKLIVIRKPV